MEGKYTLWACEGVLSSRGPGPAAWGRAAMTLLIYLRDCSRRGLTWRRCHSSARADGAVQVDCAVTFASTILLQLVDCVAICSAFIFEET